MLRIELEFLCDICGAQEIVPTDRMSRIKDCVPGGWRHYNSPNGTKCPECIRQLVCKPRHCRK